MAGWYATRRCALRFRGALLSGPARPTEGMETRMTIPPAAVIALRDLIAEWRCIADAAERELTHVRNPITQAVLTARIAAVCTCAEDLDALVARVEPPPQEPILAALEAAQQFLD